MSTSITILLSEQKGTRQHIEVKANSKETALVFLQANTIQDAFELIPKAKLEAFTAMADWKPKEEVEDKKPEKHYGFYPMSEEAAQYFRENSTKFYHSLAEAAKFTKGKPYGIKTSEVIALMAKGSRDLATAVMDAFNVGYARGYKARKKD